MSGERKRRADCTLQEWTEHRRAQERIYDAKRRAKKKEEGAKLSVEERRKKRESKPKAPATEYALDTVLLAMEALEKTASQRKEPATGMLAELENHLRLRIARLQAP